MQVGVGELSDGLFGLEHQEGDEDRHFRVLVSDVDEVVHVFRGYAGGPRALETTLDWQ